VFFEDRRREREREKKKKNEERGIRGALAAPLKQILVIWPL
jgi:hypothetical protein